MFYMPVDGCIEALLSIALALLSFSVCWFVYKSPYIYKSAIISFNLTLYQLLQIDI